MFVVNVVDVPGGGWLLRWWRWVVEVVSGGGGEWWRWWSWVVDVSGGSGGGGWWRLNIFTGLTCYKFFV